MVTVEGDLGSFRRPGDKDEKKSHYIPPLLSRDAPDVIDAGHGVDVGLGVEGAGDLARGLGVAPATHVLRRADSDVIVIITCVKCHLC